MAFRYARPTSRSAQPLPHVRELSNDGALSVILHRLGPETEKISDRTADDRTVCCTVAPQCCFRVVLVGSACK
jgi:hypothetical protein